MNETNDLYVKILDDIVDAVAAGFSDLHNQIAALKAQTIVLDEIEPGKSYGVGQIAQKNSGLFQLSSDGEWRCIANNLDSVAVEETKGGLLLSLAMSDGTKSEHLMRWPSKRRPVSVIKTNEDYRT